MPVQEKVTVRLDDLPKQVQNPAKKLLYTNFLYISLTEKQLTLRKRRAVSPTSTQPGQSLSRPSSQPGRECRRWSSGTARGGHPPRGTAKQNSTFNKNIFRKLCRKFSVFAAIFPLVRPDKAMVQVNDALVPGWRSRRPKWAAQDKETQPEEHFSWIGQLQKCNVIEMYFL